MKYLIAGLLLLPLLSSCEVIEERYYGEPSYDNPPSSQIVERRRYYPGRIVQDESRGRIHRRPQEPVIVHRRPQRPSNVYRRPEARNNVHGRAESESSRIHSREETRDNTAVSTNEPESSVHSRM